MTSMTSYRAACREFLDSASRRPGMFFRGLADLEMLLHGHGIAFLQLGVLIDSADTFNDRFGAWLRTVRSCSLAAGWAVAVEALAEREGLDPVELFFELEAEFTAGGEPNLL